MTRKKKTFVHNKRKKCNKIKKEIVYEEQPESSEQEQTDTDIHSDTDTVSSDIANSGKDTGDAAKSEALNLKVNSETDTGDEIRSDNNQLRIIEDFFHLSGLPNFLNIVCGDIPLFNCNSMSILAILNTLFINYMNIHVYVSCLIIMSIA